MRQENLDPALASSLPVLRGRTHTGVIFPAPPAPNDMEPGRRHQPRQADGRQMVTGFVPFSGRDLVADERGVDVKREVIEHRLDSIEELLNAETNSWSESQVEYTEKEMKAVDGKIESLEEIEVELTQSIE